MFGFDRIFVTGFRGGPFDDFVGKNNFAFDDVHIGQQELFQKFIVFGTGSIEWESHAPLIWIQSIANSTVGDGISASAFGILFNVIIVVS